MDREMEESLASCLEALHRGERLEDCLARYPHQAGELAPLLRGSLLVQQATHVPARLEFKAAARARLLATLPSRPDASGRAFAWHRRWSVAIATILVALLGWGAVALAHNSLPDQPLYPVKIATEEVRRALTPSEAAKAKLEMDFAGQRTYEITELAKRDRPRGIERASQRLGRHLKQFGSLAASQEEGYVRSRAELEALLERHAAWQRAALEKALGEAPSPARPALRRALEYSDASYQEAWQEIRREKPGLPRKYKGNKTIPKEMAPAPEPAEGTPQP